MCHTGLNDLNGLTGPNVTYWPNWFDWPKNILLIQLAWLVQKVLLAQMAWLSQLAWLVQMILLAEMALLAQLAWLPKLTHFGMLSSFLGDFMVWLVARPANTYFYYIKTTVIHFRWQSIGADLALKSWVTKFDQNLALTYPSEIDPFWYAYQLFG